MIQVIDDADSAVWPSIFREFYRMMWSQRVGVEGTGLDINPLPCTRYGLTRCSSVLLQRTTHKTFPRLSFCSLQSTQTAQKIRLFAIASIFVFSFLKTMLAEWKTFRDVESACPKFPAATVDDSLRAECDLSSSWLSFASSGNSTRLPRSSKMACAQCSIFMSLNCRL